MSDPGHAHPPPELEADLQALAARYLGYFTNEVALKYPDQATIAHAIWLLIQEAERSHKAYRATHSAVIAGIAL